MKRIAIILGVAAAVGVSPSVAAGGNISAQVESQVARQVVSQIVESQVVESQVVRQVVRPGLVRSALVRSALVRPALVKPAILKSHQASAARVARIHVLGR